jgi:hypothetical protein
METGQRGATARDIRDLCTLYGITDDVEVGRLTTLAKEGKQQGWWQSYDLPYATYVGLEAAAAAIKDYDSGVVPGLLQTPEYTRARHEGTMPRLDPDAIDRRVEVTMTRQKVLNAAHPPHFWSILDEAVLHRVVGSSAVMKAQLERLIEAAGQPTITVQVIPYSVGAHPALDSIFTVVEFDGGVPGVVYVEGLVGSIYFERPEDLDRYLQVFDRLSVIALSPEDTVALLQKMRTEYSH